MITASSLLVTFVVVCAGAASGVPAPAAAGAAASRAEAAAEAAVPSDAAGGWSSSPRSAHRHSAAQPHTEVPQQVRSRPLKCPRGIQISVVD